MRHACQVDPLLQRIEALPREGQYALTVVLEGGIERTVVVEVENDHVVLPTASLPAGWSDETESLKATTAAVLAVDHARHVGITLAMLQDVPGGWDVSMGNVVLADGGPTCITDGLMAVVEAGEFACEVCGARARYGG